MSGGGERQGIDPNSAAAAVGGRPTLPGIRRIATLAVADGRTFLRPEGAAVFLPVRQLGGLAEAQEEPEAERYHAHEIPVFDGLTPVGIPGENGGIE